MSNNPPSQESYDIVPVNNKCSGIINHQAIVESPGAASAKTSSSIDTLDSQNKESTRFDNIDDMKVAPLSGGNNKKIKKYLIVFCNKKYDIYALNEIESIKIFLNNRIFKKDYLIEVIDNIKTRSVYIIRGFHKNKFIKIH
jgi:hypothetical protein